MVFRGARRGDFSSSFPATKRLSCDAKFSSRLPDRNFHGSKFRQNLQKCPEKSRFYRAVASPLYLKEFIRHRLEGRLAAHVEAKTHGKGGRRPGAGRPKGSTQEPKTRVYVPLPFAEWMRKAENLNWIGCKNNLRKLDRLVHG